MLTQDVKFDARSSQFVSSTTFATISRFCFVCNIWSKLWNRTYKSFKCVRESTIFFATVFLTIFWTNWTSIEFSFVKSTFSNSTNVWIIDHWKTKIAFSNAIKFSSFVSTNLKFRRFNWLNSNKKNDVTLSLSQNIFSYS